MHSVTGKIYHNVHLSQTGKIQLKISNALQPNYKFAWINLNTIPWQLNQAKDRLGKSKRIDSLCDWTQPLSSGLHDSAIWVYNTCIAHHQHIGIQQNPLVWHFNGYHRNNRFRSVFWQDRFPLWLDIGFFLTWSGENTLWKFVWNVAVLLQQGARSQEKFTEVSPNSKPPWKRIERVE